MATRIRDKDKQIILNYIRENNGTATSREIRECMEDRGVKYPPSQLLRALVDEGLIDQDGRNYYLSDEDDGNSENQPSQRGSAESLETDPQNLQKSLQRLLDISDRELEICEENFDLAQEALDLAKEKQDLCKTFIREMSDFGKMASGFSFLQKMTEGINRSEKQRR